MGNYKIFFFFFVLAIFLFLPRGVFAANLLLNSSFENIENGAPSLWTKNVSTATLSVSSNAKTGTASASINKTNNTTGLIYLYQDVDVEPESFYSLSGYAVKNSPNFNWVILRISWRSASGEISKTDSSQLTSDSLDFQLLSVESVQVPTQAIKARIQLAANIVTPNPANPALFDDIDFSQVSPPDQPISTLPPIPEPTNTPIPTSTPSPTPTKKPTPTLKPSPTLTPAGEILGEEESSPGAFYPLEATEEGEATPEAGPSFKTRWLPKIFLGAGFLFLFGAAFWVWYTQLRTKI
jgi:hypothetical protein